MNKKFVWLALFLAVSPLVATDTLHPIVEKYLRGLNGLTAKEPFRDERSDLRIFQKLSQIKNGKAVPGKSGNSQNFILDSGTYLLLVDNTAILGRQNLVWMTTESLRSPLRISNSFTIWGSSNVTDVLGVPLSSYEWSNERKDAKKIRIFLSPKPGIKDLAYQYIELEANLDNGDISKLTFLGTNRRPIKEMILGDYKVISTKFRYPTILIRDLVFGQAGEFTRLAYIKVERMSLPESSFRPNQSTLAQFIRQYEIKSN